MGLTLHLNKYKIPFTQEYFVASEIENGPVVLVKMLKILKVHNNMNNDYRLTTRDKRNSLVPINPMSKKLYTNTHTNTQQKNRFQIKLHPVFSSFSQENLYFWEQMFSSFFFFIIYSHSCS